MSYEDFFNPNIAEPARVIAKDIGVSKQTINNIVKKFRKLLIEQLVKDGIIENLSSLEKLRPDRVFSISAEESEYRSATVSKSNKGKRKKRYQKRGIYVES